MNPAAWVERHARRRPDHPALADGDRVHASWGEFATRMAGAATGLRGHFGLSPADRVAIVMRPKDYRFVDALPTNNYGKVVKRELRDRLRAETATPGHEHNREETVS